MKSAFRGVWAGVSYLLTIAVFIGGAALCFQIGGMLGGYYNSSFDGSSSGGRNEFDEMAAFTFVTSCGIALAVGAGFTSSIWRLVGGFIVAIIITVVINLITLPMFAEAVKRGDAPGEYFGAYEWGSLAYMLLPGLVYFTLLKMMAAAKPEAAATDNGRGSQADTHTVQVSSKPPDF